MPDATNADPVIPASPPRVSRPRRKRRLALLILLAVFLTAIVWVANSDNPFAQGIQELVGYNHDQTIVENSFSISPHNFRYYKFSLPEGSMNVAVIGQFTASGESVDLHKRTDKKAKDDKKDTPDNNVEVYVLSEAAFAVWQNGYATDSVYESGNVSQGSVQATLPTGAGVYYLVFSNKSSVKTAKNVHATVLLRYKNWQPEWLRRIKGGLSS